jgi:uncharacterized protein YciI/ketosteroid isomerase-like protein
MGVMTCVMVVLGPVSMAVSADAAQARTAPSSAAAELTALVNDFLAGVSRNDASVHERFWADDLVYTRAAGERIGKAEILRDARSAPSPKAGDAATLYAAEDVRVQQYGDTAVVAFRLVGTTGTNASESYLNTGTFVKRGGRWQAVAWQATRMAAPKDTAAKPEGGGMGEVFLVLLKKGPAWTAERNDHTRGIQEGHMANIKAMWEAKKLIVAGPMGDDGDTRGVFVFQAANRAEALALTEMDPAIKAGRLVPEIHSWWVEKNALPEAGAYCRRPN